MMHVKQQQHDSRNEWHNIQIKSRKIERGRNVV